MYGTQTQNVLNLNQNKHDAGVCLANQHYAGVCPTNQHDAGLCLINQNDAGVYLTNQHDTGVNLSYKDYIYVVLKKRRSTIDYPTHAIDDI